MMYRDEIIEEVWRNRDAYADEHGHDLSRIVADLQRRQVKRRGKIVDRRTNKKMEQTHRMRIAQS
jgi:hypothetical protein